MSNGAEIPEPRSGGCLGRGCLIFVALIVFLAVALVGGAFWGVNYIRQAYSGTEPLELPSTTLEAPIEQTAPDVSSVTETEPTLAAEPTPQVPAARASAGEVQARWKAFEKAARRREAARIELSANDINTLIANDPETRGKAFVSVENNVGRVRVSVPLDNIYMMEGRFLNGEATVEASPDGDPAKARISNIVLGNNSVPESILDQRWLGMSSIRDYINTWLNDNQIATFRIENNRAIGETRGTR